MARTTSELQKTGSQRTSRHEDTIFAAATGVGRSAVGILRISGPLSIPAAEKLTNASVSEARQLVLRNLVDPRNQVFLDRGMVVLFPAPASYTGEDMLELHLHGGRAVMSAVVDALASLGLRPALAGEFTKRAFENGKLDLTAAEGIADLVNAETELQRRQALRQMDGALGRIYESWRDRLVRMLARLEAYIDFPEEDLPPELSGEVRRTAAELADEIAAHLADNRRGERLREGISVAILGAPNSGKSSLLNHLAGREAAIVSARAGTTRDVVELRLDLGGYAVDLADTAGLRQAADEIEAEGVRRALQRAEQADINILLFDAATLPQIDAETQALIDFRAFPILSRADLARSDTKGQLATALPISVKTGKGLKELLRELTERVRKLAGLTEWPSLTRARHRQALESAEAALRGALGAEPLELMAEELRLAVRSIGSVTGRVDIENILDVIFRDFCIGK